MTKTKRVAAYNSRAEAEAHARRLRRNGHDHVRVRRDPTTGKFIVELLFLGLALALFGGLFRR